MTICAAWRPAATTGLAAPLASDPARGAAGPPWFRVCFCARSLATSEYASPSLSPTATLAIVSGSRFHVDGHLHWASSTPVKIKHHPGVYQRETEFGAGIPAAR